MNYTVKVLKTTEIRLEDEVELVLRIDKRTYDHILEKLEEDKLKRLVLFNM